ncbi:MAG: hypothetical protein AB2L21_06470 [Anaerolineaceae bacterium]
MTKREEQINLLLTAELQFRLASAVRLATTLKVQPLDLPTVWVHGRHQVNYEEIVLHQEQADYAAFFLQKSATYLLAVTIKDAIRAVVSDPKSSPDSNVQAAYQIARLIRNAFAHAPFSPIWSIDEDCRDRTFAIPDVISLDTTGLKGKPFDWRHYGGPLALFQLCRFVRTTILHDQPASRASVSEPQKVIYQQGDLILIKIDELPQNAVPVEIERLPDGGIPLGRGHVLYPGRVENIE